MMLIPRSELSFNFRGAKFDVQKVEDRRFLVWVFNQFLYGEVTGIQCGHWLYHAPHLNAASFLAKQASEELSHVRKILRILSILGGQPAPAHAMIRFLSTGMMGKNWGEHVCLEMALGEGLVLTVFYALADTIDQPEIKKILESALVEEERHVIFGERETRAWLESHPEDRKLLLGKALLQVYALSRLKRFVLKRLFRSKAIEHPVLSQFDVFYDHVIRMFNIRVERLGLSRRSTADIGFLERWSLILMLPLRGLRAKLRRRHRLLTSTYLQDPTLAQETERFTGVS